MRRSTKINAASVKTPTEYRYFFSVLCIHPFTVNKAFEFDETQIFESKLGKSFRRASAKHCLEVENEFTLEACELAIFLWRIKARRDKVEPPGLQTA